MDGSTSSRWLSSSIHVLSKISEIDILSLSSTESFVLAIYFIKTLAKVVIPAKRASHCIGPPRQIFYDRKYSFTQRRTSEEVQHPADQLGFEYLGLVVWEIVT